MYFWVLLGIGVLATISFLWQRVTKGGIQGLYAKAVASLCFIAVAVAATNRNRTFLDFGSFMLFGLVCGLLGDVWLDLKWIYVGDKDSYLYAGFLFFLVGHICFICAQYTVGPFNLTTVIVSLILALVIAGIALLIEKPMKMDYGKFKGIVFLYTFVLSLTMTTALMFMIATHFQMMWVVMFVGALLFLLSDLVLSGMYFAKDKNTNFNIILNHTLYYLAQFTLATTIFCAR